MTITEQIERLLKDLRSLRRYGHTDNSYTKMIESLEVISEQIKEQDEVIAEVKEACTEAVKDPNWYDRIPGDVLYADIRLTKTTIEKIGATE